MRAEVAILVVIILEEVFELTKGSNGIATLILAATRLGEEVFLPGVFTRPLLR